MLRTDGLKRQKEMINLKFWNVFIIVISCLLLPTFIESKPLLKHQPIAQEGFLDLSQWDLDKDGIVSLKGGWEFYWNQLLDSQDLNTNIKPAKTGYFELPGIWNNYQLNGKNLPGDGYATFFLKVHLKDHSRPLALDIQELDTAYTIFINGLEIGASGVVGKSHEAMTPGERMEIFEFSPGQNELNIVLQISNFYHKKGGPWSQIYLGENSQIREKRQNGLILSVLLIGSILIIGIYHLFVFFLRKKEKSALYFGLFCSLITLRTILTSENLLLKFIPEIGWEGALKLEYLAFYLAVPVFMMFVHSLFSSEFPKKFLRGFQVVGVLFSAVVIISPARTFTHTVQAYQLVTMIGIIFLLYVLTRAFVNKRDGVLIFIFGFVVLFLSVFNEILYTNELIATGYSLSFGMFVFILSQALMLSVRYSQAFEKVETQRQELNATNITIVNEISERKKLEVSLIESHDQFQNSRIAIILGLAKLAEYRDEDTGTHLERIREYVKILATEMSKKPPYTEYITQDYIDDIYHSSILHDIGKVGIRDSILLKPGKLSKDEFEVMKQHATIGGDSITAVEAKMNVQSFLTLGRDIAYCHHEKWDGNGYPKGLKGKEIPLSARITAVADVYDALTSERPYKKAFSHETAVEIITKDSGTHFDPAVVEVFCSQLDKFYEIQKTMKG